MWRLAYRIIIYWKARTEEIDELEMEGFFQPGTLLRSIKWTLLQSILQGIARMYGYSEPNVYFIRDIMGRRKQK